MKRVDLDNGLIKPGAIISKKKEGIFNRFLNFIFKKNEKEVVYIFSEDVGLIVPADFSSRYELYEPTSDMDDSDVSSMIQMRSEIDSWDDVFIILNATMIKNNKDCLPDLSDKKSAVINSKYYNRVTNEKLAEYIH